MAIGHTVTKAAFFGIVTNLILYLSLKPFSKDQILKKLFSIAQGAEKAGKGLVTVVSLLLCAQIIVSMISLTGLGIKMSELIIGASSGNLLFALILAAVVLSLIHI